MPAYIPAEEIPELPSLRIPLVEAPLDTPRSPLRSDSARQRAARMSILREGHQRVRDEWDSPQHSAHIIRPATSHGFITPQKSAHPARAPAFAATGAMRTRDMASRLASNFARVRWDDCMWADLARAVNSAGGSEIDPASLPQAISSAFAFLGPADLEQRVRTLLEWNRNSKTCLGTELPQTPKRSKIR